MKRPRGRGLTGTGISVLLALVITGCGRSTPAINAGGATVAPSVAPGAAASTLDAALATSTPTEAAATPTPTSVATLAFDPTATPVPTPDFPAIDTLISGINADLGMDATAETDEGSPQ